MTAAPLFLVDAFTPRPFAGNPAGVCLLDAPPPDVWMQSLALELNQAETAFVLPPAADGTRSLRWFTPAVEVDLCGHATLAAAHALWETGRADRDEPLRFATRSGVLTAERTPDGIRLDFPADPPTPADPPPGLFDALGVRPVAVARGRFDYLLELDGEAAVRAVAPDFRALGRVDCRGVIVTARADRPGVDFVSRFFAPAVAVDEDPVTGSAHCTLAGFWLGRLGPRLVGFQASRRGGVVRTEAAGDRVKLTGSAVTVVRGAVEPPVRLPQPAQ